MDTPMMNMIKLYKKNAESLYDEFEKMLNDHNIEKIYNCNGLLLIPKNSNVDQMYVKHYSFLKKVDQFIIEI